MGDRMVASVTHESRVPHFAFPFRWDQNGRARVVDQGSYEEIRQGVEVLVLTHRGERLEVPEFGVEELAIKNDPNLAEAERAALNWDDRANMVFEETNDGELVRHVLVNLAHRED